MAKRVEIDSALQNAARQTKKLREPKIVLAIGKKGVGKTYETMRFFNEEYTKTTARKKGRKVLIYDTNGEFSDVDPISPYHISMYNAQTQIEIRRVLARDPDTFEHLGVDGKFALLEQILKPDNAPRGMCLLLEDLNGYAIGANSKSMVDALTTNRHKDLDIFIHFQTFNAVPPRIYGNIDILRLHRTLGGIQKVLDKLTDEKMTLIGYYLVQIKTKENFRFFVNIDYSEGKIYGDFTFKDMIDACTLYYYKTTWEKKEYLALKTKDNLTEEQYIKSIASEYL